MFLFIHSRIRALSAARSTSAGRPGFDDAMDRNIIVNQTVLGIC